MIDKTILHRILQCHIKAFRGKCAAHENSNCMMLRKNVNISGGLYRKHTPEKPIINMNINTGEINISVKRLAVILTAVMLFIYILKGICKFIFAMRYRKRF